MPSRAETRILLEHVSRSIVIAALALMLWQSLLDPTDSGSETLRTTGVADLTDWSAAPKAASAIHVELDSLPKPRERAWLGALAGAGTRVTWTGDIPPVMIDAQPIASPAGGTRVSIAAPQAASIIVSDDVGPIDTVQTQVAGVTLAVGSAAGELRARVNGSSASTIRHDSVTLKKLLVIGNAGWESKFVVAALEEDGWKVDAFIRVAPGVDVTQSSTALIDTSRYSAVIALDAGASPYANRIIEFARTGGGVVLTPRSASVDTLSALRAGAVGRANTAARPIQSGSVTLATPPIAPIMSLRSDAVSLERRGGIITTAAQRIGGGRVLQLGYDETWRWRMGGGEGAVRDHRMWWTDAVSSVAYAPRVHRTTGASTDEAPLMELVTVIGPATPMLVISNLSGSPSGWTAWLFALLGLGLISEVASRRLRSTS